MATIVFTGALWEVTLVNQSKHSNEVSLENMGLLFTSSCVHMAH